MKKSRFGDWQLQKAFPPHLPPETEADRTPRGSLLACMTASREQSNRGLELTGRRRFALRAVASCRYPGERGPRTRGTSLPGQFPASDQCPFWVKSGHLAATNSCPLYPQKRTSGRGANLFVFSCKNVDNDNNDISAWQLPSTSFGTPDLTRR